MVKRLAAQPAQINLSRRALEGLGIGTVVAAAFFVVAALVAPEIGFWYLAWNLFLAYIPLALTYPLLSSIRRYGWMSWPAVVLGLVWLVWLPNSFYVLTDVVHLLDHSYGLDPLLGVVLFCLFAGLGMAAGFMSLLAVHRAAVKPAGARLAYWGVELVLLVSSLAVYVGRTLRWNSWDVVLHPLSLAQNVVSELWRLSYLELSTILVFFVLLSGVYAAVWHVFGDFL